MVEIYCLLWPSNQCSLLLTIHRMCWSNHDSRDPQDRCPCQQNSSYRIDWLSSSFLRTQHRLRIWILGFWDQGTSWSCEWSFPTCQTAWWLHLGDDSQLKPQKGPEMFEISNRNHHPDIESHEGPLEKGRYLGGISKWGIALGVPLFLGRPILWPGDHVTTVWSVNRYTMFSAKWPAFCFNSIYCAKLQQHGELLPIDTFIFARWDSSPVESLRQCMSHGLITS